MNNFLKYVGSFESLKSALRLYNSLMTHRVISMSVITASYFTVDILNLQRIVHFIAWKPYAYNHLKS